MHLPPLGPASRPIGGRRRDEWRGAASNRRSRAVAKGGEAAERIAKLSAHRWELLVEQREAPGEGRSRGRRVRLLVGTGWRLALWPPVLLWRAWGGWRRKRDVERGPRGLVPSPPCPWRPAGPWAAAASRLRPAPPLRRPPAGSWRLCQARPFPWRDD